MTTKDKLKAARSAAVGLLPDTLLVGGAAAIAAGAGMVYEPAGYIVGGLLALTAGYLLAKKGGK